MTCSLIISSKHTAFYLAIPIGGAAIVLFPDASYCGAGELTYT